MSEKAKEAVKLEQKTSSPTVNIAFDTVKIGKQALVFVSTRQSAEKEAEEIAHNLKMSSEKLAAAADEALHALPRPTKQCERLARCIRNGTAFHHSGLIAKQRQLIEQNFRSGVIKVICSTPTLAIGVDLPAFRAVIRDLKRFSEKGEYGYGGRRWIPVFEYLQMCGRAGRPSFDNEGQAVILAATEQEEEEITERYVHGEPEPILSKLAVEPVLRTYILSLIATGVVRSRAEILLFFSRTFWAHQFRDTSQLEKKIGKVMALLQNWGFVTINGVDETGFAAAGDIGRDKVDSTALGRRVAELYIDPLTAHGLMEGLRKAAGARGEDVQMAFPLLQLVSSTLEMRPFLRVKARELEETQGLLAFHSDTLLTGEQSMFDESYDDFLASIKAALLLHEWIDEKSEDYLLEKYGVRPGELHAKIESADWLLYSASEIAKIMRLQSVLRHITRLRIRVQNGVREELLPLLQFRGVGRVRARKLFANRITSLAEVRKSDMSTLAQIIGSTKLAADLKEQLGEKAEKIKEGKRRGQISLNDYRE